MNIIGIAMTELAVLNAGRRVSGETVLAVLGSVAVMPRNKKWSFDHDEATGKACFRCFVAKSNKHVFVEGVKIEILEPLHGDQLVSRLTARIEILGTRNILSARKIKNDFREIAKSFALGFEDQPKRPSIYGGFAGQTAPFA